MLTNSQSHTITKTLEDLALDVPHQAAYFFKKKGKKNLEKAILWSKLSILIAEVLKGGD